MASLSSLRYEHRLDGAANFSPSQERITMILTMNALWDIVRRDIQVLDTNLAVEHKLKDMKASCIILDGVRDHIIPHILGKETR